MPSRRVLSGLLLLILTAHIFAFIKRRSYFPFLSYDVYREPMADAELEGFENIRQMRYVAYLPGDRRELLGPFHPYFFPFDRFIFSEVIFFEYMRVQERNPLLFKDEIRRRLKAQLDSLNARRRSPMKKIERLEVHAATMRILPPGGGSPIFQEDLGEPFVEVVADE